MRTATGDVLASIVNQNGYGILCSCNPTHRALCLFGAHKHAYTVIGQ